MDLVMVRTRQDVTNSWYTFKINARLVVTDEERSLLNKYSLTHVVLTPGNTRRDIRRAAWLSALIAVFLYFTILPSIPIALFVWILAGALTFMQIREEVRVGDLLNGRNFGARSLVQLLVKEQSIRKMSGVFAIVIEQARTWHEPEVIPVEPQPLGITLAPTPEGSYEVT